VSIKHWLKQAFLMTRNRSAKADRESNYETRRGGILLSPLTQMLYDAAQS
jgi:hypothetical protein